METKRTSRAAESETTKMVLLMYLEEDDGCVTRLLSEHGVAVFSRLPMVGIGPGTKGWYGEAAPYESRMALAVLPAGRAGELMAAVEGCRGVQDPRHPVRAVLLDVERTSRCGQRETEGGEEES